MFKFQRHANDLTDFYQKRYKVNQMPQIVFQDDQENSKNVLGRTGQYDPHQQIVTIFVTGRHGKDILRSLAHELIHHLQNERGDLANVGSTEVGYAQNDSHMRNMEREAYEQGNLCLRDWEDHIKTNNIQLYETIYKADKTKGDSVMSIKEQRNVNFHNKLMEVWGFKAKGESSLLTEGASGAYNYKVGDATSEKTWPVNEEEELEEDDDSVSLEEHPMGPGKRTVNNENKVEESIRKAIRNILHELA